PPRFHPARDRSPAPGRPGGARPRARHRPRQARALRRGPDRGGRRTSRGAKGRRGCPGPAGSVVSRAMWTSARLHAIYAIANAPIRSYPFPHIVVERVFPDDLYGAMLAQLPQPDRFMRLVDTGRVGHGYSPQRLVLHSRPQDLERLDDPERAFWGEAFATL